MIQSVKPFSRASMVAAVFFERSVAYYNAQ